MEKEYVIFSQRLAGYLMMRGFVLKRMEKSHDSERNVFIFNKSEETTKAMEEYKNK